MRRTASTLLDVLPDGNDVIDLVFEGANPNPARLACPARDLRSSSPAEPCRLSMPGTATSRSALPAIESPDHAHARKRATEPGECGRREP